MPAVGAADGRSDAEASLGEVQADPRPLADAVEGHPADVPLVDPALEQEVLQQMADRVVDNRGDNGRPEAEHAPQAARHVVLATALPNAERPRRVDPVLARVETQHDLAEGHHLRPGGRRRTQRQEAHRMPSRAAPATLAASRASRSISSKRPASMSSGFTIQEPPTAVTAGTAR